MISREKARKLRPYIERGISELDLPPEEALMVANLYSTWVPEGQEYSTGIRIRHGGKLYVCVQAHTSQGGWQPGAAPSLWDEVRVDKASGYDEWKQPSGGHNAYNIGDRVLFEGKVYESKINGNTWSPTAYPAGWELVA